MLIGTSLGGCVQSILLGEVKEKDVLFIVTRTQCPTFDHLLDVLREYRMYAGQGIYTPSEELRYGKLAEFDWEVIEDLATTLWETGKIHQPRLSPRPNYNTAWQRLNGKELWLEIVPTENTDNVAVVDAFNKYRVLRELVK